MLVELLLPLCLGFTVPPAGHSHVLTKRSTGISMCGPVYDPKILEQCKAMKVSELKAELELRAISYDGMFDKIELATALAEARSLGKADPSIVDQFNR